MRRLKPYKRLTIEGLTELARLLLDPAMPRREIAQLLGIGVETSYKHKREFEKLRMKFPNRREKRPRKER